MPLRPARAYTKYSGPPYTRKEYVKTNPPSKVVKMVMGTVKDDYEYELSLLAREKVQIRANALEAARVASNKYMQNMAGKDKYLLLINVYPHQILRENPILCTTHADRWQEGMRRAFGKPIGRAARVEDGKPIIIIRTYSEHVETAKEALKRAKDKLPKKYTIEVKKLEKVAA